MGTTPPHLDRLQLFVPGLDPSKVEHNTDGLNNDVLIVNKDRVFRFPKSQTGRLALADEARILALVHRYVDIPTPIFDYSDDDCVAYDYTPGDPLHINYILAQGEDAQERLAEQLATFLRQLHGVPPDVLEAENIPVSGAARTPDQWHQMFEHVERELFPFLWGDQREWAIRLFEPILAGRVSTTYVPVLIHGDLATYHILSDHRSLRIDGVVDFGTAGLGDPACDFGSLINQFGERFVARMARSYPALAILLAEHASGLALWSWNGR